MNLERKRLLTVVEKNKIDDIISVLERYKKLTSSQLSNLTGLSRTRCNEYFKLMEILEIVEAILISRNKFYKLKC